LNVIIHNRDSLDWLSSVETNSIGAVVCDPPYGLEFIQGAGWEAGGGFSKPGIGGHTAWPSFSAATNSSAANPTCAVCGGRLRGVKKCVCPKPHDHWKPIGKRRNPANESLPEDRTSSGAILGNVKIREWHEGWLFEVFRVLKPGGTVKAFAATRTQHLLAAAMEAVGFEDLTVGAWAYGSGFPKSKNLTDEWDGWGTALKPAWEPFVVGRKPAQ
jgi:tRNA G10  N-methylase Trm11